MPVRDSNKQPTGNELFRMVNVRNPKKRRREISIYSDINWSLNDLIANYDGTYLPLVYDASNEKDKNKGLGKILTRTDEYKEGESYYKSMDDIESNHRIALNCSESFSKINTKDISIEQVNDIVSELSSSIPNNNYLPIEKTLWENLIAQLISPDDLYIRSTIIGLIKTYHIAKIISDGNNQYKLSEDKNLLVRLINSKIILPKEIFPLHRISEENPAQTEYQKYMEAQRQIVLKRESYEIGLNRFQSAKEEIENIIKCKNKVDEAKLKNNSLLEKEFTEEIEQYLREIEEYEKKVATDPDTAGEKPTKPEPPTLQSTNTDEIIVSEVDISENTIELLNDMGCLIYEGKFSADEVRNELQEKIDLISSSLASTIKPFKKVIPFGMGLIKINDNFTKEDFEENISGSRGLPSPSYNVLGVGDLLKVEQEILCYEAGEVAHIENVLKGEFKDRSTRSLNRKEETYINENETFTSEKRDLESTDRNELSKESNSIVNEDFSIEGGLQTSGKYGVVEVQANLNTQYSNNSSDYNNTAVNYSKSVTERATSVVEKRVKEYSKISIINEFEEINKHGFENRQLENAEPIEHIVGIYRWVNKVYKNTLWNYGNRLMLEFMIPEPSAFHIMAKNNNDEYGLHEPIAPKDLTKEAHGVYIRDASDISESNYILLAQIYDAEVSPLIPNTTVIEKTVSGGSTYDHELEEAKKSFTGGVSVKIPKGYQSVGFQVSGLHVTRWSGEFSGLKFYCGPNAVKIYDDGVDPSLNGASFFHWIHRTTDQTSLSWRLYRAHNFSANVIIKCERTQEAYVQWQLDTYKAILDAYKQKKKEYDQKLSQARAREGIQIQGSNPLLYKSIIRDDLKKSCIEMMSNEVFSENQVGSYPHANLLHTEAYPKNYKYTSPMPDINIQKASQRTSIIRFFEQIFEWDQMTYKFYPYYWANKNRWLSLYNLDDNDPLFANFLKAGAARVVVPIRQGFEDAFAYFKETNTIPHFLADIKVSDPHYLSIADELRPNDEKSFIESWETTLPTSLVILQKNAEGVDTEGLPCWREE